MIVIGIDPAFRANGFGVCEMNIEDITICTFKPFKSFLDVIDYLKEVAGNGGEVYTVVENSNLQNTTFDMKGSKAEIARKSRNVGCNQAISQITQDICKKLFGEKAFEFSPNQKGAKWDNKMFMVVVETQKHILVNYKGNINEQDKRDSYKLALMAFERNIKQSGF